MVRGGRGVGGLPACARACFCVCVSLLPACAQAVLLGAGARGKHACCSADAARENLILFIIFNILLMTFA